MNFAKRPSRRVIIGGFAATAGLAIAERHVIGSALAGLVSDPTNLKTGDFTWQPERSPSGPVAIIVSLPEQQVYVYRNGVEIAVSTCSTGKPGHSTPTGVFTILQKDKHHHSSTYNNAPMPNMNRLTWGGIALHAGKLPGYPASHGCVRLPMEFSERLFGITHLGTPVIIANAHSAPADIVHPGQILSADARAEFAHVEDAKARTPASAHPVSQVAAASEVPTPRINPRDEAPAEPAVAEVVPATAILVSSVDQRIIVMDNGEIVAEGTATIDQPDDPLGHHVFVLSNVNDTDDHLHWHTFGYQHEIGPDADAADLDTIHRIKGEHVVIEAIRTRMHPGTVMITVDQSLHEDTRSVRDFTVITTEDVG